MTALIKNALFPIIVLVYRTFTMGVGVQVSALGVSWQIHGDLLEPSTIHLLWMLGAR
jgi:hypothetical protein